MIEQKRYVTDRRIDIELLALMTPDIEQTIINEHRKIMMVELIEKSKATMGEFRFYVVTSTREDAEDCADRFQLADKRYIFHGLPIEREKLIEKAIGKPKCFHMELIAYYEKGPTE